MNVIDLCDSDDDETDTWDTQNQRLDTNQNHLQSPSSTAARVAAVAQRPRSISSASNSPIENSDDVICLSDDENDQEQQVNSRVRETSTKLKKARDRPMSAREKSWAAFQQMRREAAKEKAKPSARTTSTSTRVPQKKSPPTKATPSNEKRKRKRSNSNLEHRKKPPTSSTKPTPSTKPTSTKAKSYDNSGQGKKPSFLEQGLRDGTDDDSHPTNQQDPPEENVAADSLGLLSSLASLQPVELYDTIESVMDSMNAESQDNPASKLEETDRPTASHSGATLNAAIEIDSDSDDDDDDGVVEVSQQKDTGNSEADKSPNDASEQSLEETQQRSLPEPQRLANPSEATAATDYHPILQLASVHPPEQQQHENRDNQGSQSSNAQDSSTLPNELMDSGSVANILDHRFNGAGKLTFEVEDYYGAVHRGILLEDLKVDAPALLSNYILGKARGKLAGKEFREWAVKTRKKLAKKAMRHLARQERMAREMDGSSEADAGSEQPAELAGGSSHVPIDINDDDDEEEETEFELDSDSSRAPPGRNSPNLASVPDLETRDDNNNNEIQTEGAPEQSGGPPLAAPNEQGDEATAEIMKEPPRSTEESLDMSSGDDPEDPPSSESSSDGLAQGATSANEKASAQMDPTKTLVPELNEEVLREQREEDTSSQTESRTSESALVGSRPAYTAAEVAFEMEEEDDDDDDDEIEVIDVKAPPTREDLSPPAQHQTKTPAEQTPLDTDDDSVNSVQSVSPPPSSSARQPLVGSVETPIDIDNDEAETMDGTDRTFATLRDFCTQKRKTGTKGTKPPPPTSYSFPERRFVFHQKQPRRPPPSARRPTANTWTYGVSCDAAMREQERLFQASAAKMRSHTTARVATSAARSQNVKFQQVVPNIAEKYPLHWQFSDHSARLGVPEGSSKSVIKKQYRRLALIYHPDKSQLVNTATKFQNITEAYRALLNL
mmetsp:Transcript_31824/g.77113  ORF Transcript_31824/g.77113 Transcript_31824/m.77113 type:complete len:952 (-) Transcript_31824:199-3054(-)